MTTELPPTFSVEKFIEKSEAVKFREGDELPETMPFLDFIFEVCLLFDSLGRAGFSFVRSDLETKSGIIRSIHDKDPEDNETLQQMVEREMAQNTERTPASGSRTLLRLMWGCQFIRVLIKELDADDTITTKEALRRAYDKVLAPHHPWLIRKTVGAALHLAPDRNKFLAKLGVDMDRKDEYLKRIESSLGTTCDRMYAYYEKHGLLDLP